MTSIIKVDNIQNSSGTDAVSIDSSGNVLAGKSSTSFGTAGVEASAAGGVWSTRSGFPAASFNRLANNGPIAAFYKDGTLVGSIGSVSGDLFIDGLSSHTGLRFVSSYIQPRLNGATSNGGVDLGHSAARFDDIFAVNGTIQTSDQNEKQQIASLTSAEITAAKAISKLFKTFKWNDSVADKGASARTHTGVIAQQVETAMTDAGLDADDYAFFISADWHVDANGDEVEADAVGAIAKNRKGIRYPELLAFVGAANEQRLADIETRLTALENA